MKLRRTLLSLLTCTLTLLVMDLLFLGVIAADFYRAQLGALQAPSVFWPAAIAFYALYLGAVMVHAVVGGSSVPNAAWRGGWLGLVAYGTFDLTNLAIVAGWPALLVPVDMAWGVVLTACVGAAGRVV